MVVPNGSNIFRKNLTFYYYIILFIYFWVLFTFHFITANVIDPFRLNVNVSINISGIRIRLQRPWKRCEMVRPNEKDPGTLWLRRNRSSRGTGTCFIYEERLNIEQILSFISLTYAIKMLPYESFYYFPYRRLCNLARRI